ncbi:hypothetical protein Tco_0749021 [Tanacetum coccineum]|uniref:Uncharacterized protein n=1 Tax=Tanacetum coccineum TaxID=301880 RepID=A0ABQ4Z031_9ASTR
MVKQGKNFSGKVTPLFDSMLVQQTEDEGDASERPSDSLAIHSPPYPSEDQPQIQPDPSPRPSPTTHILDSIPEGFGGNHEGQSSNDASLSGNEDGLTLQSVKKLKKGVKPLITHHKAWMKTRLARKTSLKKKGVHKEYVSKQWRKSVKTFKGEPSMHKDPAFDDLDDFVDVDDTLDYMENEDVQDERRNEGTEKGDEGTDKKNDGTDKQGEGTVDQDEGKSVTQTPTSTPTPTTPTLITPTPTVFGDDETIAQVLIIMSQNKEKLKEKEKGVEIRNVEETERPRPTSTRSILTLRPLPKIDPKDKGKKRIEEEDESDTESEGITEAEKKFKQLANDEEVARKVQEEWEAEEEKKRLAEEEATKAALSNEYDFIQARLNADKILAEKLQEEERERCKKHSDLKTKGFEEIKALYDKIKRSDDSFIAIGSAKDEKVIKEMNKQVADASKKRFTSKDDEELRLCLTIVSNEDKEVDYEILDKKYPIIEWRSEYLTTKPQYDETEEIEDVYLNVVIRSLTVVTSFGSIKSTGDIMNITEVLDMDASLLDAYDWGMCCDGSSIGSSRLMLLVRVYAANTSLLLPGFINVAAYYF